MKINKENVKERLAGVPEEKRSHIYDASIVLEFLASTFMPTKYFLPDGFKPAPGTQLGPKSMRKLAKEHNFRMSELYYLYLLYREDKDYTMKIESRYIFGIIIRNLRYYKNQWEFIDFRVGTAQIWHVGPLLLRADVPAEKRNAFLAKQHEQTVDEITVEADPVSEPEEDPVHPSRDEDAVAVLNAATKTTYVDEDRFVEVHADRFKEAKFEVGIKIMQDQPSTVRYDGTA